MPDHLMQAVVEIEQHVAAAGWDAPVRLFALVRTREALSRDPELAARLPAHVVRAASDSDHLTSVEQDGLPDVASLEGLLATVAWPASVDGAAVVVERLLEPGTSGYGDVRLAAAVLRDGRSACAVRTRRHDSDDAVLTGPVLVPALVAAVRATLDG